VNLPFPSLCSIANDHPFVPTCPPAEHRAQRQSRRPSAPRRHRRSRRKASLTERARCYASGAGTIAASPALRGYRPTLFPCLLVGGPPPFAHQVPREPRWPSGPEGGVRRVRHTSRPSGSGGALSDLGVIEVAKRIVAKVERIRRRVVLIFALGVFQNRIPCEGG